jgi:hypothetical protein
MKTILIGSLVLALTAMSGVASATPRCQVLKTFMDNTTSSSWMWRAASVEYMNYCL